MTASMSYVVMGPLIGMATEALPYLIPIPKYIIIFHLLPKPKVGRGNALSFLFSNKNYNFVLTPP